MKFACSLLAIAMVVDMVDSTLSTAFYVGGKHPLEDRKSWDLHIIRQQADKADTQENDITVNANTARLLKGPIDIHWKKKGSANKTKIIPYKIKRKKPKKHIPFAGGDTTHGIMIDAGSQGTRLHIYEWDKNDLLEVAQGKKLSYPTSNSRWTDKYTPGLDVFIFHKDPDELEEAIGGYLGALLDFARMVLKEKEDQWHTYPIFLKATGGLRTLPQSERVRIMDCVRKLFHNKTYNPFAFEDERARVISGEEEAIYGWVGINFAKGTLIDASEGVGAVAYNPKLTYGMLEMGGASTQIAVFENHRDVMANLFKLQLGGSRHWNVYVHSYLYSGINGAWSRLNARLNWEGTATNPCLPIGSSIEFSSWIHLNDKGQMYARSHPESTPYTVTMNNNQNEFDFQKCSDLSFKLLRKEANKEWCDFETDGNCGYAGVYQPPMPQINKDIDMFIATSNFADVFEFLQIGELATVSQIGKGAERVCGLTYKELKAYNKKLDDPIDDKDTLKQLCFRSVYVYQMIRNGWEFGDDYEINAVDVINGQKLGWALGCMLYEINTLPWDFHPEFLITGRHLLFTILYMALCTLVGLTVGFVLAMRLSKGFNKKVRQSVFFGQLGLADNEMLRRSMAIPDDAMTETLQELEKIYDEDDDANGGTEKDALRKDGKGSVYT